MSEATRDQPMTPVVTISQIAELADVGTSAVSNWRKRFDDFPAPLQSAAGGRDLYGLREVERWLQAHKKLDRSSLARRLMFEAAAVLRSEAGSSRVVEILCAALALVAIQRRRVSGSEDKGRNVESLVAEVAREHQDLAEVFSPLTEIEERGEEVFALVSRLSDDQLVESFDWLLERRGRYAEARSPEGLTKLLVSLAIAEVNASADSEDEAMLDPAAGEAGFLVSVAKAAEHPLRLFGQELNESAWRIAKQRLLVHDIMATIAWGDSLMEDAFPDLRAEIVLCDPPYAMAVKWPTRTGGDPRWRFGQPSPKSADYAWLQHAIHHLADEGRGYVVLPSAALFRRGREAEIRRELIRQEAVEAIVALPPGSAQHTGVALALWVVRRPRRALEKPQVLLVDASHEPRRGERAVLDDDLVERVVKIIAGWRKHSRITPEDRQLAAAVPLLDLVGGEVNLVPARWLLQDLSKADLERRRADFFDAVGKLNQARSSLMGHPDLPSVRGTDAPTWVPVGQLVADGRAEVVRGSPVRSEDCVSEGIRVLRTRDIAKGIEDTEEPCFVDPASRRTPPAITLPGDVVLSPASGKLRAVVDEIGGHALASPLQGLRIVGQWLDPHVVATFLEGPRNRRFVTGTAYARVNLRDLELPLLTDRDASGLRAVLDWIETHERAAEALEQNARTLREALLDTAFLPDGDDEGTIPS